MMITKYWWFLKIIQPFSSKLDFYEFYRRFLIDTTTYIPDCNEFDVKFIIHPSSKLKKLNYKFLILHENKLHYTWDIIYILEPPKQSSRSYGRLSIDDCSCNPPLRIISEQSIEYTNGFIYLYSLNSLFHYATLNPIYSQA